jgi:hypothetical protein
MKSWLKFAAEIVITVVLVTVSSAAVAVVASWYLQKTLLGGK